MSATFGIDNQVNPAVFSDTKLSELISLPINSLDELIDEVYSGKMELWVNPLIEKEDLEQELSLSSKFLYRLLLLMRLLLILGVSLFTIYTDNYFWLFLLPAVFAMNWVRDILFPFKTIAGSILTGLTLSSFLLIESQLGQIISSTLLLTFVWGLTIRDFRRKQLLKNALGSESKFIEQYFRNVILVTKKDKILNSLDEVYSFIEYSNRHTPPKLNHKDRIFFCKQCKNASFSKQEGIVCGLSGKKPDFEFECADFDPDFSKDEKVYNEYNMRYKDHSEAKEASEASPAIINFIAVSFILSEAYYYWRDTRAIAFNSGISDWLVFSGDHTILLSAILPLTLLIVSFLSEIDKRISVFAVACYSLDTIFCFFYKGDVLSWYTHLIFLPLLIVSVKNISLTKFFANRLLSDGVYMKSIYEIDLRLEKHVEGNPYSGKDQDIDENF